MVVADARLPVRTGGDILQTPFMRHAFVGGTLVALAAGLLGYFVVVRQHAFAAHALAHIGFPGRHGGGPLGIPVTLGLGRVLRRRRARHRRARQAGSTSARSRPARSSPSPPASGCSSARWRPRARRTVTNVLFGNLLAITTSQLTVFALFTAGVAVVLAVIARPLTFASVDPQVAEAKGVPVKALGVVFLLLLALVITMAVQVVGTLLLFALVVTPCATALLMTAPDHGGAASAPASASRRSGSARAVGDVQSAAELLHRLGLVRCVAGHGGLGSAERESLERTRSAGRSAPSAHTSVVA